MISYLTALAEIIWFILLLFDYADILQGMIFVDRDGKHFRHILNWLRDGVVPALQESEYHELLREAEYYQLLVNNVLHGCYKV